MPWKGRESVPLATLGVIMCSMDWMFILAIAQPILSILVVLVGAYLWFFYKAYLRPLYRKLNINADEIRQTEDKLDAIPSDIARRLANIAAPQTYHDKMIAKDRLPLERQLERLKQERQFIIDVIPFFKK